MSNITFPPVDIVNCTFNVIQLPASVAKESVALLIGCILGVLWAVGFIVMTHRVSEPPKAPPSQYEMPEQHDGDGIGGDHEYENDDAPPPPPPPEAPPHAGRAPPQPPTPPPR